MQELIVIVIVLVIILAWNSRRGSGYAVKGQIPDVDEGTKPDTMNYDMERAPTPDEVMIFVNSSLDELKKITGGCWEPIATQYANKLLNSETGEWIITGRITYSEVKKFVVRDYYSAVNSDGKVTYIQAYGRYEDTPGVAVPYDPKDNYSQVVPSALEALKQLKVNA